VYEQRERICLPRVRWSKIEAGCCHLLLSSAGPNAVAYRTRSSLPCASATQVAWRPVVTEFSNETIEWAIDIQSIQARTDFTNCLADAGFTVMQSAADLVVADRSDMTITNSNGRGGATHLRVFRM
jgi:hypothetical protein